MTSQVQEIKTRTVQYTIPRKRDLQTLVEVAMAAGHDDVYLFETHCGGLDMISMDAGHTSIIQSYMKAADNANGYLKRDPPNHEGIERVVRTTYQSIYNAITSLKPLDEVVIDIELVDTDSDVLYFRAIINGTPIWYNHVRPGKLTDMMAKFDRANSGLDESFIRDVDRLKLHSLIDRAAMFDRSVELTLSGKKMDGGATDTLTVSSSRSTPLKGEFAMSKSMDVYVPIVDTKKPPTDPMVLDAFIMERVLRKCGKFWLQMHLRPGQNFLMYGEHNNPYGFAFVLAPRFPNAYDAYDSTPYDSSL